MSSASHPEHLDSMLRACTLLQSVRELYASRSSAALRSVFENHLLTLLLEFVPAATGAIFLDGRPSNPFAIDSSLLAEVIGTRAPILRELEGRFILLTPLLVRDEVAGVIYLEREAGPFTEPEALLSAALAQMASMALENAFHLEFLEQEVQRLESGGDLRHVLIGESPAICELRDKIARIARRDVTVLITGESGTGKEVVARALHQISPRALKPFVAINCAALTETLLESELFGHEKGAFTGAISQKRGRLEVAESGTVFLDEIGEMPLSLQAKMLRVLQQREFERVGGTRTIRLDIRLIAATNRNMEEAIRRGYFRQDLFYRLNVVTLRAPPLRERPEDILLLANRFASRLGERVGRAVTGISPNARALLRAYSWPGNVRELENAIEHSVVLGASDLILAEDLPDAVRASSGETQDASQQRPGMLRDAIYAAKRAVIERALAQTEGDYRAAAVLLGVHPNYLYRLMKHVQPEPCCEKRRAQRSGRHLVAF